MCSIKEGLIYLEVISINFKFEKKNVYLSNSSANRSSLSIMLCKLSSTVIDELYVPTISASLVIIGNYFFFQMKNAIRPIIITAAATAPTIIPANAPAPNHLFPSFETSLSTIGIISELVNKPDFVKPAVSEKKFDFENFNDSENWQDLVNSDDSNIKKSENSLENVSKSENLLFFHLSIHQETVEVNGRL